MYFRIKVILPFVHTLQTFKTFISSNRFSILLDKFLCRHSFLFHYCIALFLLWNYQVLFYNLIYRFKIISMGVIFLVVLWAVFATIHGKGEHGRYILALIMPQGLQIGNYIIYIYIYIYIYHYLFHFSYIC